jgi:hypothetical protein
VGLGLDSANFAISCFIRLLAIALFFGSGSLVAQQNRFGGKYEELNPRQKELGQLWVAEFQKIFNKPADPATVYDRLPVSARTTFEAATHALSRSRMTSGSGKPYGVALDLIELVERVAGTVPGTRGDSQYRIYVYLKPGAVDKLYNCREFKRDRDNTVFHIGYPINFRQQGGAPSIQISVARTGQRADIDVDYRPSSGIQALTSGRLTAANSDVRAGNNYVRHIHRWDGLGEWWRDLMAGLLSAPVSPEVADFTPEARPELRRNARGPLPEMIHAYLTDWLIKQQPIDLLSAVSIKAYPCVAEFADGSHPDSKLALLRILNQLREVNQRLGNGSRLEDAVAPAAYPLPESEPVKHQYSQLFTVQRVHDDIGWAIDCRIRYQLNLAESIPRPEHRLDETFVASFRINDSKTPGFFVQTWQKESGAWKLISFEINRKFEAPPPDLLAQAVNPAGAKAADSALQATVETFLTAWLIDRRLDAASAMFLPESYACDALAETGAPGPPVTGNANVRRFLQEVVAQFSRQRTLQRTLSAAEAGHPELKPLLHPNEGSYLLAGVSTGLMRMYACDAGAPPTAATAQAGNQAGDVLTAFHLSRSRQKSAGVISLYWKTVNSNWRIASFTISAD